MSLMGTLGKVAVGVMVAKGASSLMRGGNSGGGLGGVLGSLGGNSEDGQEGGLGGLLGQLGGQQDGEGGLGGLLGQLGGQQDGEGGGLGDLLGGLGQNEQESSEGGLGGLLGQLGGGGNLGQMLGGLAGGAGAAAGLGGILNSLGGGGESNSSSLGDLFNSALQGEEPEVNDQDEQNARLLLSAMISAAKADGHLDDEEQAFITKQLEGASEEDIAFVREQLQAPVDIDALVADVPAGMEQQMYFMSLLGITLDTQEEAQYMQQLAQALNLDNQVVNNIHQQAGVQPLFG